MRDLGINKKSLHCNTLLTLYHRIGDANKFDDLIKEMDDCGIPYNVITYNILVSSYGAACDVKGMERTLIKMESDSDVTSD